MKKKLSINLILENGKNMAFTISNIKEISIDDASNAIKAFDYKKVLGKNDIKAVDIKNANIISTKYEEITFA